MSWFSNLRNGLNAPYEDVQLSPEEASWWAQECRRTRWRRWMVTVAQSVATAFGPNLPRIINAPDLKTRLGVLGFATAITAGTFLIFGTLNERAQLRIAKKDKLPRYRLRKALLAELDRDSGAVVAEPAPARRLERHDVA